MFHRKPGQISPKSHPALQKPQQTSNTTAPQVKETHPATLLQRAKAEPSSLSANEVLTLQSAIGNREVSRLLAGGKAQRVQAKREKGEEGLETTQADLSILNPEGGRSRLVQPKLAISAPGDQYEQEADRVAAQVMRMGVPSQAPSVQRESVLEEELQTKPITASITSLVQRGIVPEALLEQTKASTDESIHRGSNLEAQLNMSKDRGSPLPGEVRSFMEPRFGADFSQVRVHTGGNAVQMNRDLNARAFTHGLDVYFGSGHTPGKDALTAHELTHVVQQTGGVSGIATATTKAPKSKAMTGLVQRDIGFEFETKQMYTKRSNIGSFPLGVGFANPNVAEAAWVDQRSTRVAKGESLLKKSDVDVQADDNGSDSDLEVVTTHFPLDMGGRTRLDNAMNDVNALANAQRGFADTAEGFVPAAALHGTAGFNTTMLDGMILGKWTTAKTSPQLTFGTRVGNIGDIVRDLHGAPGETTAEKQLRDPGRLRIRPSNLANASEPRPLTAGNEAHTLVLGNTRAREAIAAYQARKRTAPGGSELEGLLTIVFTYCEGVQYKNAFLKQHTPLIAKTNLATIFTTLPINVRKYYSQKDRLGVTKFEKLVAQAPGYAARMKQPLFAGARPAAETVGLGGKQWYHNLTLQSWLRGIVLQDPMPQSAVKQFFLGKKGSNPSQTGVDQLTTASFPGIPPGQEVEGYGALGAHMDTDMTDPTTQLPIFELRSASRQITYVDARQWALDLFDYVRSLNEHLWGGYTHIQ